MLDHARLKVALHYDPETGVWTRLQTVRGQGKIGDRAGSQSKNDYVRINLDGHRYLGHRLAWFYMTGEWPFPEVDHENTIKQDNRWRNLRLASNSQNSANYRLKKNNTSGYKGVTWFAPRGKWRANICFQRKRYTLGYTNTPEEAALLYQKAAKKYFGKFARHA